MQEIKFNEWKLINLENQQLYIYTFEIKWEKPEHAKRNHHHYYVYLLKLIILATVNMYMRFVHTFVNHAADFRHCSFLFDHLSNCFYLHNLWWIRIGMQISWTHLYCIYMYTNIRNWVSNNGNCFISSFIGYVSNTHIYTIQLLNRSLGNVHELVKINYSQWQLTERSLSTHVKLICNLVIFGAKLSIMCNLLTKSNSFSFFIITPWLIKKNSLFNIW